MNEVKEFFDSLAPSWDRNQPDREAVIKALIGRVGIQKGDSVLDLACGTGTITSYLHDFSNVDVLGLDLSPKMIEIAKAKYLDKPWAHFEDGDFLSWSSEMRFDVIVLYNAYPHFKDPSLLSECFAKHLKPNGRFAILHSLGRVELDEHHAHVPSEVSRSLASPKEEAKHFEKDFEIYLQEEGKHHYLLGGIKLSA